MGRPAARGRSARPHRHPDIRRYRRLRLQLAVELRLGEKSAGGTQDLVSPTQLLVLALQCLDPISLLAGRTGPLNGIDLRVLDPSAARSRTSGPAAEPLPIATYNPYDALGPSEQHVRGLLGNM